MKTKKLIVASLVGCFTFISCDKKNDLPTDTTSPNVSNVLINGAAQINSVNAGDTLLLSASFSDDQELGKLEVLVTGKTPLSNWSERIYVDLSGKAQKINRSLAVLPNATEGMYSITLEFTDNSGNKSIYGMEPFEVINKSAPKMHDFKAGFDGGSYEYQNGDTLRFTGYITDDEDIQLVAVRLRIPEGYGGDQTFYSQQYKIEGTQDTTWDFAKDGKVEIYFPPYSKNGDYRLDISIMDNKSNRITETATLNI